MNLPIFSNEEELASLIHVDSKKIKLFSTFPHRYYKKYKVKKSNGGFREIKQPTKDLKGIQAWILRNILDKLSPSTYAIAYVKKRNIADNVSPHSINRYFICLDIEDFFPSISIRRVAKVFSTIGYSRKEASILAKLCTCNGGLIYRRVFHPTFDGNLPQGAVTSPSLSNLIAAKLDRRIAGYISRRNIVFTRYADDMTLSSNNYRTLCQSLEIVLKIIKSEHFKPNVNKLRVLGPRRRCYITGLVKDSSESKFGIGRRKKKHMRAVMHHHVFKLSEDKKYRNRESILGWLNYLRAVDKGSYEQMNSYWNKLSSKSKSI
jgi:retron-type reverse transcriptase